MARIGRHSVLVAVAVLALAVLALPARAAGDDAELRRQALALNDITGTEPMRGQLRVLIADPAGTKKLLAVGLRMIKEKNQPLAHNATFILARAAHELKDFETSRTFYELSAQQGIKLQSVQHLSMTIGGLIELYYENKKYDECTKMCQEFLQMKGDPAVDRLKVRVVERMIQAIAKQDKIDEALKLVDNLVKAEKEDGWWALSLRGWVLHEAGKYQDSIKTYEEVLDRVGKDKSLKKDEKEDEVERFRYILSGLYVDMKRVDKAADVLKNLLAQKPDDPTYNNDLGYIWADHDMNLDEAEKLIRKAIEEDRKQRKKDPELLPAEDKDNAAYLDSLGWVLYKQKKFKEAKPYLLQAIKDQEGQHLEIYDHLADVHMALGEKPQAIAAWKKGLEVARSSKREQERKAEIEKKLKAADEKDKDK
jgi:tetratricopeptide (TPR) repeat protein